MEKLGWKRKPNIREIKENSDNEKKPNNKNSFLYDSSKNKKFNVNGIFYVKGHINNKEVVVLIDTGAEVTVLSHNQYEINKTELSQYQGKISSVTGEYLKVLGRLNNKEIKIGKCILKISPLVLKNINHKEINFGM